MEHISRFIDTMGPHAGDKELCLKEFAKSLIDQAYNWYTTLRSIRYWDDMIEKFLRSIRYWDDMIEKFRAKYYSR